MEKEKLNIDERQLLEFLRGMADEATRKKVMHWLAENQDHQQILDQLETLWIESGKIVPPPVAVDTESALNLVSKRIRLAEKNAERPFSPDHDRNIRPLYKIMAAASILLIAGMALFLMFSDRSGMNTLSAQHAMVRDTLSDGTTLCLEQGSTLSVPSSFKPDERNVILTGKAFFNVKHNDKQPFIIDAGIVTVKVLGTSFSVDAVPGDTIRVAVLDGTVMVSGVDTLTNDSLTVILNKGESGAFSGRGPWIVIPAGRLSPDAFFWATQTFEFRNTSLSQVFTILENHFRVKISISNQDILSCRLSASFENDPVDRIMEVITETFGFGLKKNGDHFFINGNGCHE